MPNRLRKNHWENKRYAKARIAFKNVLQINPKNVVANYQIGLVFEQEEKFQQAFDSFLTTVALDSNHIFGKEKISQYLFSSGYIEDALDVVKSILELDPKHETSIFIKAMIFARLGKYKEAITVTETLLSRNPKNIEAIIFLATLFEKKGEADKAVEVYQKWLVNHPNNALLTIRLAGLFGRIQLPANGEELLLKLVDAKPDDVVRWRWLTAHYLRTKQLPIAIETIEKAATIFTEDIGLKLSLAALHLKSQNQQKATAIYQEIIKQSSSSVEGMKARLGIAGILMTNKELEFASKLYRAVVGWKNDEPQASKIREHGWLALGYIALGHKQFKDAVMAFQSAVDEQPTSINANNLLGRSLLLTHKTEKAKQILKKVVELDQNNKASQILLAQLANEEGQLVDAGNRFKRVLEISPNDFQALSGLSAIQSKRGKWLAAAESANMLRLSHPNAAVGHLLSGNAYYHQKWFQKSAEALEQAVALSHNALTPISVLARSYLALKQSEKAVSLLVSALKGKPTDSKLHNLLGKVQIKNKEPESAQTAFEKAIKYKQDWLEPRLNLARLLLGQKKTESAVVLLKQATEDIPNHQDPFFMLAAIYVQEGQVNAAMKAYEQVLRIKSDNEVAVNNLAVLLLKHGQSNLDIKRALELVKKFEYSSNPNYLDTLGWAYYKSDDYESAVSILKKSIAIDPKIAEHHYHLGMALYKMGKTKPAALHLKKSIAAGSVFNGHAEAKKVLDAM
ncbi:MAG: tetratricopeptide repeat protein [Magnetococcales bacterium]|nr:tetratricopeptide repeat protein [Magnetococcales bacterium]